MNRQQRISRQSRHAAGWAIVNLAASVAAGVWAVRVAMVNASGGALLVAAALVALCAAVFYGRKSRRLSEKLAIERFWDSQRAIRPRL